jgi:hypothetical protein
VPGIIQQNKFLHVAMTYNQSSGTVKLFCAGNVVNQQQIAVFPPAIAGSINIGYREVSEGLQYATFRVVIDEVCLYNRALSDDEIKAIYDAENSGKPGQVTPPTISMPTSTPIPSPSPAPLSSPTTKPTSTPPPSSGQDAGGGNIASAETRSGTITPAGDTDAFTFQGATGQGIVVEMAANSSKLGTSFYLYNPVGALETKLVGDTDGYRIRLENYRLKQTGVYTGNCGQWGHLYRVDRKI